MIICGVLQVRDLSKSRPARPILALLAASLPEVTTVSIRLLGANALEGLNIIKKAPCRPSAAAFHV